jgi:phytoene desaturase
VSRVVVIGAGMGGLAVAARLARQKHDVLVVEAQPTVGGKLGWESDAGFSWDTGPSLVTIPQALRDLFRKTGRPLEKVLDLVALDPIAHYRFADGVELDLPGTGPIDIERALTTALGPDAGADWTRLMGRASAIWEATRRDFVEAPLDGMAAMTRMALRRPRDVRTVAPWRSLRGLGSGYLRDPRLRMLLDRYATYSGSDPRRAPAALACVPYVEQAFGAWYVPGGLRRIADATHQRALDCGASFRLGDAVTEVLTDAGRVSGVRLASGEAIAAEVVVSDADASFLYGSLLRRPDQLRRIRKARPSYSAFVMLLGLSGRTPGLRHHTVLFPENYDAEFDDLRAGRAVADPTLYISAPDDPALRPDEDSESWFVLANAPRHSPTDRHGHIDWHTAGFADAYAERLLATLAARGLEVRDRVRVRRLRTPADIERETGSPGGAIYGTSSDGARAAFLRPANRSPVPGLFLVGGSAHPGGGLPLVTLSAAIVAELIGPA